MTLREDLKNYVPMYLWEIIEHPEGYTVTNEEFNARWNLLQAQGDQQANFIRDILELLYQTILNDTDGVSHIRVNMPEYAATNLKRVLELIDSRLKTNAQNLTNHKVSGDHDRRYYTKDELLPWLRGGDTLIREEVFVIENSNLGDGTFTYRSNGQLVTGTLGNSGEQIFTLTSGTYEVGKNRIEIIINDALRRSVASGGVQELGPSEVMLTSPEGAGTEITIKYYERIGFAAEYNVRVSEIKPPLTNGKTLWFEVIA